jgi:hypothetical protein
VSKNNKRGIVQQALFAGPSFSLIKMTSSSASREIVPVPISERRWAMMGYAANKLVPVVVVVKDFPPLDTIGHNVVEDALCIEP